MEFRKIFSSAALALYATIGAANAEQKPIFGIYERNTSSKECSTSDCLLGKEKRQAEDVFTRLLSTAGIEQEVLRHWVSAPDILYAAADAGCYSDLKTTQGTSRVYFPPVMTMYGGLLWLDRNQESIPITSFVLAHETAHIMRTLSRGQSCKEEKALIDRQVYHEELEADKTAVWLLDRIGYDGVKVAADALTTVHALQGQADANDPHPPFHARLEAVKNARARKSELELEHILKSVSFPMYVFSGTPSTGTGFYFLPGRNSLDGISATAGHVFEYIIESRKSNDRPKISHEGVMNNGMKWKYTPEYNSSLDRTRIASGIEDPVDFALFWNTVDNPSLVQYMHVAKSLPAEGEKVYSLGADDQDNRRLATFQYPGNAENYLQLHQESGPPMRPGTSGTPIIDAAGELVGISVRSCYQAETDFCAQVPGFVRATNIFYVAPLASAVQDYKLQK